jgi:Ca-activated chloride channel homolog
MANPIRQPAVLAPRALIGPLIPARPLAAATQIILTIVVAIAAILAVIPRARGEGAPPPAAAPVQRLTPATVHSGALLLRGTGVAQSDAPNGTQDGAYVEAPLVATDVDVTVSGPTARGRVTQLFRNPTDHWVEAVYVYPLSEGSAVDTLKIVVGERIIVGDVMERKSAQKIYEDAKAAGHKAALMTQERPNIFTNSVANIGPGESVLVQIEYQEPVHQSGNQFSLRIPLVVAPRYNPAPVVQTVALDERGQGWGEIKDPVPNRARITPPVLDPRKNPQINPVAITVRLQAGFPLGEVTTAHHKVTIEEPSADTRIVRLADKIVPAERDFELTWTPAVTSAPSVGLFREHVADADYLLAFVMPPALADAVQQPRPREMVFVIDNSGSMGGTSITQAKASLLYALAHLKPGDRFNVIRFDDTMDVLFPDTVPADAANLDRAKAFVAALEAHGGTEMVPAMKAALSDARGADGGYLRQVVFLTDGEIGNEQQLFETIAAMRGRSRVYMVGIGSAPNSFLMTRAAEIGRGTYTHIGSVDQVEARMRELFDKLENPIVTGLTASYSDQADFTPAVLPDLYRGEPVILAAKVASVTGAIEIKGNIGDRPWVVRLPLANAAQGQGISKLWARRKIADAEVARTLNRIPQDEADRRVLALALAHHLVSRLTSLVAVDATPSRPAGAHLTSAELPLNLPAGWDFDKVFGPSGEQPDAPAQRKDDHADASGVRLAAAAPAAPPAGARAVVAPVAYQNGGVPLPKTATDAELRMIGGAILMVAGFLLLTVRRFGTRSGIGQAR